MPERKRPGLDHRAYRRATRRLRSTNTKCWICKEEIDTTLPYTHPRAWTADHVVPRSKGGALLGELKPAHRDCNSRRGNRQNTTAETMPTTRDW